MAFAKLIPFDRPLLGAMVPGQRGHLYTETEVAARAEEAYRRGVDSARALADQQMVEFRADVEALSEGVLKKLTGIEANLFSQLRDSLPELTLELARRLLAGYEPTAEVVARLCEETIGQLYPERDRLELVVCPRDAELLTKLKPDWMQRYPDLRISTDVSLAPGDCQVRSRFGLTDARQQTKLNALTHSLSPT